MWVNDIIGLTQLGEQQGDSEIMNDVSQITFDDLDDLLAEQECETAASELQGIICGMFAGGLKNDKKSWKQPLIGHLNEGKLFPQAMMQVLDDYVDYIGEQLEKDIFALDLLLPPEQTSIEERLEKISEWTQGFLFGYGLQMSKQQVSSPDLMEALEDMMEIAKVDLEVEETEEMEQALATVVEHVRVSSQVVYLETRALVQAAVSELSRQNTSIH
ncbi:MAG: UPF0149 family protein [Gammaproteobacteria bacterium]|nr:UPF0149 family protein [Gammaproteobacteria bacterium]